MALSDAEDVDGRSVERIVARSRREGLKDSSVSARN
jgi:hypothetical protein